MDILVKNNDNEFATSVYTKPTNKGNSECPQKYLESTVLAFINRAYTHSSDINSRTHELERVTKLLINNGYKKSLIDKIINQKEQLNNTNATNDTNNIILYYKNHMSTAYLQDEKIMKKIIRNNVKTVNDNDKINIRIYYANQKTSSMIMKNNNCTKIPDSILNRSHLIYSFTCKIGDCLHQKSEYIGVTDTKLSRRLTMHVQSGAIKNHLKDKHKTKPTRDILDNNIEVLHYNNNKQELRIAESLLIEQRHPIINIQQRATGILPSHKIRNRLYRDDT